MKQIIPLNIIIALRFLGLFIVLPVLSVYTLSLPGANNTIVGIVIGGYALTQMIFQVPFGFMSDLLGRKETIIMGLILIALGSIIAGIANDVMTLLFGRLLQGAGAIGAVVTATISDLVKEEIRTKAMAMMGGSIAVSFALAMVLGPWIGSVYGVNTLFFIVASFSILSIFLLFLVPNPPKIKHSHSKKDLSFLKDKNLIIMNITNFLQKGFMTFAFMIIPIVLVKTYGWDMKELYKVYMPSMIAGIVAMGMGAVIAEKKGKFKQVLMIGIVFFALAYYIMGFSSNAMIFGMGVVLFFIGFNMHEPIMQSLASKFAKAHQKGTVLGVFNSFGYLGTFVSGALGGYLLDHYGLNTVAYIILIIAILWLGLIISLPNPSSIKSIYIPLQQTDETKYQKLHEVDGCIEWYINKDEEILVVKYNSAILTEKTITNLIKG